MTLETLLVALGSAHDASALRHNISHDALILATQGSGDYVHAVTAAMMTIGGAHAPVVATCYALQHPDPSALVSSCLEKGVKVPGWGNGFVKDGVDPLWREVDAMLREMDVPLMAKVDAITDALHRAGKLIYPNPSCYTAAVAVTSGIQTEASPFLFISGRLAAWTREYCRVTQAMRGAS